MSEWISRPRWRVGALLALAVVHGCSGPLATVVSAPAPKAPPITDGRGVIAAMHAKYAGRWFSTLSFSQRTTTISASGRETRGVWNEYLTAPGRLRIDYTPLGEHAGVLYTGGRVFSFVNGKSASTQNGWNPLLVLIADVYAQPVDTTLWQLDSLGFRTATLRSDSWEGKPVWVVGATVGDSTSSQFWIDADSLLVRRVIQKNQTPQRTVVSDIRLAKYSDVGGYPVAFDITFHRDGRLFFHEEYYDARVNEEIPDTVFDPARWVEAQVVR